MRKLNVNGIKQVNGGGDAVDGAIGGAAIGATVAVVVSASNPVTFGIMAVGAVVGAAIDYFTE